MLHQQCCSVDAGLVLTIVSVRYSTGGEMETIKEVQMDAKHERTYVVHALSTDHTNTHKSYMQ